MTENDWFEIASRMVLHSGSTEQNKTDVRIFLYHWADWVEEQGLGYERGLRLMADFEHGPRYPQNGHIYGTEYWKIPTSIGPKVFKRLKGFDFLSGNDKLGASYPHQGAAAKATAYAMQETY